MLLKKNILMVIFLLAFNTSFSSASTQSFTDKILPARERAEIQNEWLKWRFDNLLPEMMKAADIDLWIVINREYNEDAVYFTLAPQPTVYSYRTTIVMFHNKGDGQGVERLAASDYGMGNWYAAAFTDRSKKQFENLADVIKKIDPKKIGINTSETWHLADGLNATMKTRLENALGPEMSKRLVSAEKLCIDWLQVRSLQEIETYKQICAIAHGIIREGSSNEHITPNVTTVDDVRWWFRQRVIDLGLDTWFHPVCDIQRNKDVAAKYKDNPNVIRPGDLIHCDFGIKYLGLCTDMQWYIYICRENETDAPEGLKKALDGTLKFGEILTGEFKESLTGDEIAKAATQKAQAAGINSMIYSHSLGNFGHSAGTRLDTRPVEQAAEENRDRTHYPVLLNTVYAIEYCCFYDIPEWNNEEVRISFEDDAALTKEGCTFLDGHQEQFFLIK
jgi:Xaa-Pro aminopeptidase